MQIVPWSDFSNNVPNEDFRIPDRKHFFISFPLSGEMINKLINRYVDLFGSFLWWPKLFTKQCKMCLQYLGTYICQREKNFLLHLCFLVYIIIIITASDFKLHFKDWDNFWFNGTSNTIICEFWFKWKLC